MINTVVFAILFAAFGCLGCYFSFAVCPEYFVPNSGQASVFAGNYSYNFCVQFGVLGLSVMIASLIGLLFSIKSLKNENDDKPVVASFLCYIAIGYIFTAFFLINAVWLYRLIGMSQIAWWIVLCVVLFIACLLGTNIPMMKLLEDADTNIILTVLNGVLGATSLSYFATVFISLLFTSRADTNIKPELQSLLSLSIFSFVIAALSIASALLFYRNYKKGIKDQKLPSLLGQGGLLLVGAMFITASTIEYLHDGHSLQGTGVASGTTLYPGLDFVVMGIILGSLIVIGSVALCISTFVPAKKNAEAK